MKQLTFEALLLFFFVAQNSTSVLVGRHTVSSVSKEDAYHLPYMILCTEVLKFVLSCCVECYQTQGKLLTSLKTHVFERPWDCCKVALPALLYYCQNYSIYAALKYISAPLFQITYQSKLVTTAILSTWLLDRRYTQQQWLCIFVLATGVAIAITTGREGTSAATSISENLATSPTTLLGLLLVGLACLCSSLAGVYFERVLKNMGTDEPVSMWIRNIQLSFFSVFFALLQSTTQQSATVDGTKSFFHGFTAWVWFQVILLGFGGLLVAACIKYTSSVTKGLVTGISVVASTIASNFIWGTPKLTASFGFGASFIVCSVYIFANPIKFSTSSALNRRSSLMLQLIFLIVTMQIWASSSVVSREFNRGIFDSIQAPQTNTPVEPDDWTLPGYHIRPPQNSTSHLRPMFPARLGTSWAPLLHRRPADGHPFLLLLMIQQTQWMPMAFNFVVSLKRLGIHNVTISSTNNDVLEVAQTLGLSVFNTTAVVHQMPSWFQPLPSWTWGVDMWQRYVTSFHAIRQGIGTCHFDVDTAIQSDVFFAPKGAGPFDITIQGHAKEARKRLLSTNESVKQCNAGNAYDIRGTTRYSQFYVNPGYACYAANERTFKFFEAWNEVNRRAVARHWSGWLQPAFNNALCHGGISATNCTETECRATVDKYGNMSMAIFKATGLSRDTLMKNPREALAVHPKSCHKKDKGNQSSRAQCKTEFLKNSGFWYVPFELPLDANGWKEPGLVDKVRYLLHGQPNSTFEHVGSE